MGRTMEITTRPRRRGLWRAVRALVVVAALVCVALLVPPALGLQTHVVGDDALASTHGRGDLVFDEPVPMGRLAVGDVVTLTEPGTDTLVTRRVFAIDDDGMQTRGDAAGSVDPWRVPPATVERVVFSLPLLGYPLLAIDAMSVPPWAPGALVVVLAIVLLLLRRTSRPSGAAFEGGLSEPVPRAPSTPPPG